MTITGPFVHSSETHRNNERLLTDFAANSSDLRWYVVSDNVMGGRSAGTLRQDSGELIFTGRTNTNGGGFSSIRTGPLQLDLSQHDGIRLFLEQHRWNIRTLVISAPNANDADLEVQQAEVARYAEAFADRDMVLVTLLEDARSTAGDRELTTEEAAAVRDALRIRPGSFAVRLIGKDGSVKLSRDTATPMAEIYALIDTMPMRRREVSERR